MNPTHKLTALRTDFWYRNLDKLIHYVNLNGTVNAFYSTPSFYVDQKKKDKTESHREARNSPGRVNFDRIRKVTSSTLVALP